MNLLVIVLTIAITAILFFVVPRVIKKLRTHNESSLYDGVLLNPKQMEQQHNLPISKIVKLNHDTYIFSLEFPDPKMRLGIEVGQHIVLHAKVASNTETGSYEEISRKYTPVSKVNQKGTVDLLVKVYHKCEKFPNGGQMTLYLESLKVGDRIRVSGPKGKLAYLDNGKIIISDEDSKIVKNYSYIGMVAGGTGISPVYQIIRQIFDNPQDNTQMNLLYANKSENDILLYEELVQMNKNGRIKLSLTLDTAPPNWGYYSGYITKEMLAVSLPSPGSKTIILFCGPPPMNRLVRNLLLELGHQEANIYKF